MPLGENICANYYAPLGENLCANSAPFGENLRALGGESLCQLCALRGESLCQLSATWVETLIKTDRDIVKVRKTGERIEKATRQVLWLVADLEKCFSKRLRR